MLPCRGIPLLLVGAALLVLVPATQAKDMAGLVVVVTGPKEHLPNRPVTYSVVVVNASKKPATNVTVTADIPHPVKCVSANDGGKAAENEVLWDLGTLAPGDHKVVRMVLVCPKAGTLISRAVARFGDAKTPVTGEAVTEFFGDADKPAEAERP